MTTSTGEDELRFIFCDYDMRRLLIDFFHQLKDQQSSACVFGGGAGKRGVVPPLDAERLPRTSVVVGSTIVYSDAIRERTRD